jgi:ribonuclease HI
VHRIMSAAGKRTSPEAEQFSLQVGLSAALHAGAQSIVIFSDSLPAIESLLDCSIHSGQIFSLDACKSVQ